ncbi:MAG: polyhydroxybutyrate depolymerase [Thermoleophilaceae bacterium]|nr:polyhydroxybutyrate depolymerase [Thermoleophilaceae bacterium]
MALKRFVLPFAAALILIQGLSSGVDAGQPPVSAQTAGPCSPGDHTLRFTAGGEAHQALLHVPPGAKKRLPLVVAFHGARYGAHFVSIYYGLSRLGDRKGFAVLYPEASHNVFWQLPAEQTEDVDAARVLLDQVERQACVDSSRVYATGASNGGGFTARLGCELADRLAAIAPVAGGYAPLGPCNPSRPLPVLEIHGTRDQVVPYGGKGPDRDGSVARFLGEWTELDGCTGGARRTTFSRGVAKLLWSHCAGGSVVEHLRLAQTNHGWPGGDSAGAGFKNPVPSEDVTGVDAAAVVWGFLSRFRLPAAAPASGP